MGYDLTRDAIIRIGDAVRWVEKNKKVTYGFTGTNGALPISNGDDTRIVRITEEICKGTYEGVEVGFMNSTSGVKAQWHSWKDMGTAGFNDDPYVGSDSETEPAGSHAGVLQELNFRENIPVGTIVYAYYNGKIEEDNTTSEYMRSNLWIFDWKGAKGHFMANPYFDVNGFRFFQINCGLVQIGDVEVTVDEMNIPVDNVQCSPSPDVCDPSQVPCPSDDPCCMDPTAEYYWVEVTFTYNPSCCAWVPSVNTTLQNAFCKPDLWDVTNADGTKESPTPDDACPTIEQIVIWRLVVGYVDGFDWVQAYAGAMQYPSFSICDIIGSPSPTPSDCEGFDGNRVLEFSGEISVRGDFLYQTMVEVQETWDNGKLCEYLEFFRERVVGHWCCPSPLPSVCPSPSPSYTDPSSTTDSICIEDAGWSEQDINGTYTYNAINGRWEIEIVNFTYWVAFDEADEVWYIGKSGGGADCYIYVNGGADGGAPPQNGWTFINLNCGGASASTSNPTVYDEDCATAGLFCWSDGFGSTPSKDIIFSLSDDLSGTGTNSAAVGDDNWNYRWDQAAGSQDYWSITAGVASLSGQVAATNSIQNVRFRIWGAYGFYLNNWIHTPATELRIQIDGSYHETRCYHADGRWYIQYGGSQLTNAGTIGHSGSFGCTRDISDLRETEFNGTPNAFTNTDSAGVSQAAILGVTAGGGISWESWVINHEDYTGSIVDYVVPYPKRWAMTESGGRDYIIPGETALTQEIQNTVDDAYTELALDLNDDDTVDISIGYREDGVGSIEIYCGFSMGGAVDIFTSARTSMADVSIEYDDATGVVTWKEGVTTLITRDLADITATNSVAASWLETGANANYVRTKNLFSSAAAGNITSDTWLFSASVNSENFNDADATRWAKYNSANIESPTGTPYCAD